MGRICGQRNVLCLKTPDAVLSCCLNTATTALSSCRARKRDGGTRSPTARRGDGVLTGSPPGVPADASSPGATPKPGGAPMRGLVPPAHSAFRLAPEQTTCRADMGRRTSERPRRCVSKTQSPAEDEPTEVTTTPWTKEKP